MSLATTARVFTFLFCCSATPLFASQLWGVVLGNSTSVVLHPIDPATGMVGQTKSIGMGLNFANVDDLASDPARQPSVVWVIRSSLAGNELIAVDPFQEQLLSVTLLNAPAPIVSLAIDPTDGVFYGATTGALYRIAPDTGATALIGATAMPVDKALGFDNQGNLYGIANNVNLVSVNKTTGATSLIAPLNLGRMEDIAARPEDGVMFGLGFGYSLYRINVGTGQLLEVGPSLSRPGGLAFTAVLEPTASFLCLAAVSSFIIGRRAQFNRRPSSPANRWNAPGRIESGSWSPG
jgi:hypothetical protein